MTVYRAVRTSLTLLNARDRRILILASIAQMATAILDLFGVLLLGAVAALSVSIMNGSEPPALVNSALARLGLEGMSMQKVIVVLAVSAGVLLILKTVVSAFINRRVLRFLANRQAVVSSRLAAGLLSRPLLQVQARSSQETAYALTNGANTATLVILGQGVVAVGEIALLAVLAVGLFFISPTVTVFTIVFFAVVALSVQRILSAAAGRLGVQASRAEIDSYASVQEALATYREILVANRRQLYIDKFRGLRWEAASVQSDLQFVSLVPKYVFEVALVVGAGLLAVSQLLTKDVDAAVAVIAVFLAAGSRILPSILRLHTGAVSVRIASGQAEPTFRLARELDLSDGERQADDEVDAREKARIVAALTSGHADFIPEVEVEHVSLTYPGAASPALDDLSMFVPAGSSVALVGSTGAGKSTLADSVLGVLAIDSGHVTIGGVAPIEAIGKWPGAIAYVPQEVAITTGTVRENVALGLPDAYIDDERVWEALGRAHLADFLRDTREGLDTVVGEAGVKLSGGQRQRLGVARALYTRPLLLVLDEATSALDAETEQSIADTLRGLAGNVTTITIAHRLATIRHCDQVVYLQGGRMIAQGTFEEVREAAPQFDAQAQILGL